MKLIEHFASLDASERIHLAQIANSNKQMTLRIPRRLRLSLEHCFENHVGLGRGIASIMSEDKPLSEPLSLENVA